MSQQENVLDNKLIKSCEMYKCVLDTSVCWVQVCVRYKCVLIGYKWVSDTSVPEYKCVGYMCMLDLDT